MRMTCKDMRWQTGPGAYCIGNRTAESIGHGEKGTSNVQHRISNNDVARAAQALVPRDASPFDRILRNSISNPECLRLFFFPFILDNFVQQPTMYHREETSEYWTHDSAKRLCTKLSTLNQRRTS